MIHADLNNLELNELFAEENPEQHCRVTFPILGAHGSKELATVYFELDPGEEVGSHTDSAEELLLIMNGSVEVIIGDETGNAEKGQLAVVPKMVPHNIRNIGTDKVKVLGFFGGANNIVATFEYKWSGMEANVVDTAEMAAAMAE
jgi:quercetin dioxygenase-like cupin family protein